MRLAGITIKPRMSQRKPSMSQRKPSSSLRWRQRLLGVGAAALVIPVAAGMIGGAAAVAAPGAIAHTAPAGGREGSRAPAPFGDKSDISGNSDIFNV